MKKALIIGAGISGLATAIRLASDGLQVDVIEKEAGPGGKIGQIREQGFRFDTGPSLMTWPELLEDLFTYAGKDLHDHLPYHRLSTVTRYFFPGGKSIDAPADPLAFADELNMELNENKSVVLNYLNETEDLFNRTKAVFLENDISVKYALSNTYLEAYPSLPRLKAGKSLNKFNSKSFKSQETVQLFNRYATYNGSNPFQAPATLRVIAHLEHNSGAYFPEHGMYSIAQSLFSLAEKKGVRFHFNESMTATEKHGEKVTAIITSKGKHEADFYINTTDIGHWQQIHKKTLPGTKYDRNLSSSALIFFWGMNTAFPQLSLHNIFFSSNYKEEFEHIFQKRDFADDLTVYVFISSKAVKGDAPEGMENWFVMVNAPPDFGQDWQKFKKQVRNSIIEKLEHRLGKKIEHNIVTEHCHTPVDIAKRTGSYRGALYGPSSNTMFSAFRRQANQAKQKNLFFTGGSVHPGGGIPLCLLSAKIVSNKIRELWKSN